MKAANSEVNGKHRVNKFAPSELNCCLYLKAFTSHIWGGIKDLEDHDINQSSNSRFEKRLFQSNLLSSQLTFTKAVIFPLNLSFNACVESTASSLKGKVMFIR